jgi:NAD(P)-dependent dehydrogenase (short-subunit alcohol dehydrogenase family)
MMRFLNSVAVVTGAASGIGRATAAHLAQEGAAVVVVDINADGALETVKHIEDEGGRAFAQICDVSKENEVRTLFADVIQRVARVDVLVNCAAVFLMKGSDQAGQEDWQTICAVNIAGVGLCSRYAADVMQRSNGGAIVVVSSINGSQADVGYATYCTSKAALLMLTRCMALDFAKWNIRVNSVSPGIVDTPALRRELARTGTTWAELDEEIRKVQCLPQVIQPEDIARSIVFLASDQARMITGSNLIVDGGYLARK